MKKLISLFPKRNFFLKAVAVVLLIISAATYCLAISGFKEVEDFNRMAGIGTGLTAIFAMAWSWWDGKRTCRPCGKTGKIL